jgi:secretion/DNA translocation related TadE-like protein
VSAIACVLAVAALGVHLATATVLRHRVEAAADLAALAAATKAASGKPDACERARWVVERMSVLLDSCRIEEWDVVVELHGQPLGPLGGFGAANAHARAGPPMTDTSGTR